MKKIAILLALSMMLAGCTELEEIVDNLDATYTTQDLDGTYYGMMLSMRVAMNADETFDLYIMEMKGCYGSASEAQEVADDMNQMAASDDTNGEESESSVPTHVVIDGDCVAEEGPLVAEDGMDFTATLDSMSAIPTLSVTITEAGESLFAKMEIKSRLSGSTMDTMIAMVAKTKLRVLKMTFKP